MNRILKINSAFWITLTYIALSEVFSNAEALLKASEWSQAFPPKALLYGRVFLRYLSLVAIFLLAKVSFSRAIIALFSISLVFYMAEGYFVAIAAGHLYTLLQNPSKSLTHSNSPTSNPNPAIEGT